MTKHFFNFDEKSSRINLTECIRSERMPVGQLSAAIEKIALMNRTLRALQCQT